MTSTISDPFVLEQIFKYAPIELNNLNKAGLLCRLTDMSPLLSLEMKFIPFLNDSGCIKELIRVFIYTENPNTLIECIISMNLHSFITESHHHAAAYTSNPICKFFRHCIDLQW
jgi:hypothetical protein